MSAIGDWESDYGLPNTLHNILKEVEINNSYTNEDMTSQLQTSLESSYAYLHRLQYTMVPYHRFDYQTREYLLNTTESDIQDGLKYYGDILLKLEQETPRNESEILKIKEILADFGEVRFGDFFLDKRRRVCMEVPFDIVPISARTRFRTSQWYDKELSMEELASNSIMFETIPVISIDSYIYFDILVKPIEKGTRIIFRGLLPRDIYESDGRHKFHETIIQFIPNADYKEIQIPRNKLTSDYLIPYTEFSDWNMYMSSMIGKTGILFTDVVGSITKLRSEMIECRMTNEGIYITPSNRLIQDLEKETGNLTFHFTFFFNLHKHTFYQNDAKIPCVKYVDFEDDNPEPIFHIESKFFVLMNNDGTPYSMPIPRKNIIIHNNYENEDGVTYKGPQFNTNTKDYYPNIYQVSSGTMTEDSNYTVYYFYYEDENRKHTPIHDFYYKFLQNHYNKSIEEILNIVYFKDESRLTDKDGVVMDEEVFAGFYDLFIKMIQYEDYNYNYNIVDFYHDYTGDDIPLQYKIAKMREFVRADYKVLQDYVVREKNTGDLYHFFVNTINLRGRFRRSTIMEDENNAYAFGSSCEIVTQDTEGALLVVSDTSYNTETEIYLHDARLLNPDVQVGNYVLVTELIDRYVFAFRNEDLIHTLPLRIYVDGIWAADTEVIHKCGTDYLYIPAYMVKEDSYIMIERDYFMPKSLRVNVDIGDSDRWHEIHLTETPLLSYTMNDISVENEEGVRLDDTEYTIEIVKDGVPYDMYDERHEKHNKYGIVTTIRIRFDNISTKTTGALTVVVNKTAYISKVIMKRRGYPRLYLDGLESTEDIAFTRMYHNGRLVPNNLYKYISVNGVHFVQSRIFAQKGDTFVFEVSPYARDLIYTLEEVPNDYILDFTKILNKPADSRYYEFFLNGRRLGIENVFEFGPHHAVLRGTHSRHLLEIYEKERDFEYFGYESIALDGDTTHYFFTPKELIDKNFLTEEEINTIIENYIESVKDKKVTVKPNDICEADNEYDVDYNILEDLSIFYYEDLLPLEFVDPNKLQFNNNFLKAVYPHMTERYMENDSECIFLNPDIVSRSEDGNLTGYTPITMDDVDTETMVTFLWGENELND